MKKVKKGKEIMFEMKIETWKILSKNRKFQIKKRFNKKRT